MVRDSNYIRDLENLKRIYLEINFIENYDLYNDTERNVYLRKYLEDTFDLNKSYISRNLKTGELEFVVLNDASSEIELNTYEGWLINNRSGAKVNLEAYEVDVERINGLFELIG